MYIYDLVLNFSDIDSCFDFFEWDKEDKLVYVDKILAFKVNSKMIDDIINYRIIVSNSFLDTILNTTTTNLGKIKYSCLLGDNNKVFALEFSSSGEVVKRSSLLLDEEEIVIDEITSLDIYDISYSLLDKNALEFLTRSEKVVRNYLLAEINNLYESKSYDEISYLYFEIFNSKTNIQVMYNTLIDGITNHFNDDYLRIYEIVMMV
ncbi:MAG: hypothetical protein IJI22_04355 [Bacilli bacterium]|nr:hypothetical protein [Bacilli bacterium]